MPGRRRSRGGDRPPLPPGFSTIWTTVAIDLVGFGVVLPILPRYAKDLDVTPAVIGLVVASFSVAQMVGSPILGRLSDRFGRKPVLLLSLCGTALGSLITGLAGTVWLLVLGRVVDGASGASVSVAQAAVADVASPDQRPRLLGLLGAAFGVGFVVGPAIGALAALGGKHVPFFVAAAIAAANALVALRRLPETHPQKRGPSGRPEVDPVVGVDGPGLTGAGPGPRGARPLPAGVWRMVAVAFVSLVAFAGFEATFSLLLEDRFGFTIESTGAVFTAIGLALVLVQAGFIHPVAAALGERRTVLLGLAANGIGLVLLAVDGGYGTLVPSLLCLVVGQGLLTPTLASAVAAQVDAGRRGQALGYQQSAGSLARAVGPALAGLLYGRVGIPAPYLVGAGVVAVALVLVPRSPARGAGAPPGIAGPGAVGLSPRRTDA